jgi:SAM-dependent methyltransferase
MENMQRCLRWYGPDRPVRVVDLGSAAVNGSYRELFGDKTEYIGLDLESGPGVDMVLADPYRLPFADASIDLVVSGQMLEHCPNFWRVFTEISRVLKTEGLAFIIAPSAGPIHRYPVDCYRFYPDSYCKFARNNDPLRGDFRVQF